MSVSTKVTILLTTYNGMPHLVHAVDSILDNTKYPYELLIIESESNDGSAQYCDWLQKHYKHIKVIHTKREGYLRALNFGLENIKEGDVYITQDDVILPKLYMSDWLYSIVRIINMTSIQIGLVTTLNGGGRCGPEYIDGFNWIGTWSLYIPRNTINKIGYFDEKFAPGNGEDIDYTYRVVKEKLPIFTMPFWVNHHRRSEHVNDKSIKNLEEIKKRNAKYFRKKHKIGENNEQ